jgi:hypothetical protein
MIGPAQPSLFRPHGNHFLFSDDLKGQVYEALGVLAQGFLDYPGNGLTGSDENLTGCQACQT